MKKLLAICAAAALALGIAGCANEDATLSVDDALDTTWVTATLVTNVTNFTLKDSAGEEVEALEINFGDSAVLTPSTADGIEAESDDEDVAKATVASTGKITVEGVAAGSAVVTVTLSGITAAVIPVTVNPKVTYTVEFKGLQENPTVLTATINEASAEYIDEATDLQYTIGTECEKFKGSNNSAVLSAERNGSIIDGAAGYKVTSQSLASTLVKKDSDFGAFYVTVKAKENITLDSVSYTVGSSSGDIYANVAVYEGDDLAEEPAFISEDTSATATIGRAYSKTHDLSAEGLTLNAGDSATIAVIVEAGFSGKKSNINYGISAFKIVAVAAEE